MALEARVQVGSEEVIGQHILLRHVPIRFDLRSWHITIGKVWWALVALGRLAGLQVETVHRLARIVDRLDRFGKPVDDVVAGGESTLVSVILLPLWS